MKSSIFDVLALSSSIFLKDADFPNSSFVHLHNLVCYSKMY